MNKLKKGLTYISERGSFYRYSDKVQDEKWLSPLSEYIPLEEIMRGQPVSIATDDDIKEAAHNLAQKYYKDNEETTLEDFEVEIKRPESLGGGSFKTFLEWNDNVFWNIA